MSHETDQPEVSLNELPQQKHLETNLKIHLALSKRYNNGSPQKRVTREITSRYKAGITRPVPNYAQRFPSPDFPPSRAIVHKVAEVSGGKRAMSSERRVVLSSLVPNNVETTMKPKLVHPPKMPWPSIHDFNVSKNAHPPFTEKSNREIVDRMAKPTLHIINTKSHHSKYALNQSDNASPQKKSSSRAKQDKHTRPCASTLKLFGSPGIGKTSRNAFANQALSQIKNEGSQVSPMASSQSSFNGEADNVKAFEQDLLQDCDSVQSKQISLVDCDSQFSQTSRETGVTCASGFKGFGDMVSDTEGVSSDDTSGSHNVPGGKGQGSITEKSCTKRVTSVPARFCQDITNRLLQLSSTSFLLESKLFKTSTLARSSKTSKVMSSGLPTTGIGLSKLSESLSLVSKKHTSPVSQQRVSPMKLDSMSSTSKGLKSPANTYGQPLPPYPIYYENRHVPFNLKIDVRRGKRVGSMLEAAHLLCMLYTRLLQWHFVNAKAESSMRAQNATAEKLLYNVWVQVSELQLSVRMKRAQLYRAKQTGKLKFILSGQMDYLEEIDAIQKDHSNCLSEAIGALEAATVQLPFMNGVRADIETLKEVLDSASDVMQLVVSSISTLLLKVEQINSLLSELARVVLQERVLLDQCSDLLAQADKLVTEESSLFIHLLQLKQQTSVYQ